MADISDVLTTLSTTIAGFVYPNGLGEPSITGKDITIFPGWPMPQQIDNDVGRGAADISIFPTAFETNTTRYRPRQQVMSVQAPTLTLTVSGNRVTVGGVMPSPFSAHNLAIVVGGKAFLHAVQSTDTLTSIATAFALLLSATFSGTSSSGPVITVGTNVGIVVARVGTFGTVATEWERQNQRIQISVWAPDPATRSTIGAAIKTGLAQLTFVTLPDGFGGRVLYKRNMLVDLAEKVQVYRRDFFYDVEYPTTVTQQLATVVSWNITYETTGGVPIVSRSQ